MPAFRPSWMKYWYGLSGNHRKIRIAVQWIPVVGLSFNYNYIWWALTLNFTFVKQFFIPVSRIHSRNVRGAHRLESMSRSSITLKWIDTIPLYDSGVHYGSRFSWLNRFKSGSNGSLQETCVSLSVLGREMKSRFALRPLMMWKTPCTLVRILRFFYKKTDFLHCYSSSTLLNSFSGCSHQTRWHRYRSISHPFQFGFFAFPPQPIW